MFGISVKIIIILIFMIFLTEQLTNLVIFKTFQEDAVAGIKKMQAAGGRSPFILAVDWLELHPTKKKHEIP